MTFANVVIQRGQVELMGYLMEDGTFQFIMDGKMHSFPTLMDVWKAWADLH